MNSDKKNKLLLWSPYGSGEHYSGPAKYTYRVYSELDSNKYDFTLAHGSKNQGEVDLFSQQHLIRTIEGGKWSDRQFVKAGKAWLSANASKFDLLHAVSGYQVTIPAADLARRRGLPIVLFVSNEKGGLASKGGLPEMLGIYRRRQKMAREFDAIVALSSEIETELLSLGIQADRIVRIPNFADTDKYKPVDETTKKQLREELELRDVPTIVFLGRVGPRKRPHLISEALAELKKRNQEAQAVFVGPFAEDEPYYQEMISTAKSNNVIDQMHFTGFTNDVPKWLQASDFFCLPSSNEGMPGALVEAMACGLVSIVSPFSSAGDLVQADNIGRILTIKSAPSEIADAVIEYLSEKTVLNGHRFRREFVEGNYSLESVAKMYDELFTRLIASKSART